MENLKQIIKNKIPKIKGFIDKELKFWKEGIFGHDESQNPLSLEEAVELALQIDNWELYKKVLEGNKYQGSLIRDEKKIYVNIARRGCASVPLPGLASYELNIEPENNDIPITKYSGLVCDRKGNDKERNKINELIEIYKSAEKTASIK